MVTASFGGLLKDFRMKKGMTQNDVAYAMGWSEASRLSRIEQGKTKKPNRETVDHLMQILRLDRLERGRLLLAGGYVPTDDEVAYMRQRSTETLSAWQYPVVLIDFTWRMIAMNRKAEIFYGTHELFPDQINKTPQNALSIIFHPVFLESTKNAYFSGNNEDGWEKHLNYLVKVISHFKNAQKARSNEKWYISLISEMMKEEIFRSVWKKAPRNVHEDFVTNFGLKAYPHPKNPNILLKFYFAVVPVVEDPRFEVEFHMPANDTSLKFFRNKI